MAERFPLFRQAHAALESLSADSMAHHGLEYRCSGFYFYKRRIRMIEQEDAYTSTPEVEAREMEV